MHAEAYDYVRRVVLGAKFDYVIEYGSKNINGTVREVIDAKRYWGIDIVEGKDVDEVADAFTWRSEEPAQCIVCCEVLEHLKPIDGIIVSARANLSVGGWLVITCATDNRATHSAVDGGPLQEGEWYCNVAPSVLEDALKRCGFSIRSFQVNEDRGDLYAMAVKE